MTMLPDIDEGTYTDWAQDDFKRKAKEKQDSFGGFPGGIGDQIGQFAGGAGQAIGGAASGLGSTIDAQRQQLQSAMSQIAPTAQAPSAEVAASQVPPQPAAALPAAAPGALAPPEPAGLDIDSQRQQLQAAISQRQPDLAPTQDLGQTLDSQRQQLQAAMGQIGPLLQHANQPPLAQPQQGGDLQNYARQAAQRAGVDPDIFVRQIQQESGFDPNAGSPAGARGIAQIVPKYHPGVDVTDPYASLDYAANLMKSNVARYGGDYARALAAYNAGAGAVEQYGGVPPFQETQTYIKNILGGAGQAIGGAARAIGQKVSDISQFGDPQLSNDEAYAACGPAAAVRFAQRFGRNPTLREATDLASSVGWSSGQGMAGIGSEQALMTKLGVPTTLVQGPQWDRIAAEAQTGNPVTISTAGHYFYADSFNPQTGQFHVGRSGTDLRGGSEWMTADQMTSAMGPVQGALLANNPTVSAPSTADSNRTYGANGIFDQAIASATSAADQGLAALRGSVEQGLQRGRSWADEQARNLDQAVQQAGLAPTQTQTPMDISRPEAIYSPSETLRRQAAGEESAHLGVGPVGIDIPGPIAAPFGLVGEVTQQLHPGTQLGRVYEGTFGSLRRDTEYMRIGAELDAAERRGDTATADALRQQLQARFNEVMGQPNDVESVLQRAMASPDRETAEMAGQLITSGAALALAPRGAASGLSEFAGSLALDPSGAPFAGVTEGLGKLGGLAARVVGRGAPEAGDVARIVENVAHYPAGGLEDRFEQLARASAAASPDGLAHIDLKQAGLPFAETVAPTVEGGGVASVHIPHLDDIRAMVDNGLPFSQWYTDMAERAAQALGGEHNLPEFATNFGITSQRTRVDDNLAESLRVARIVREAAADAVSRGEDPRAAALQRLADMSVKAEGDVPGDIGGLAGKQKKISLQNAYSQGGIESAGPKTPSYIGNFMSAFNALFDPRTTNDTWVAQMFGVRGDTPLNRYANNDRAYRSAEVALNEIAREMGIPGHQAQAAAWYSMQRLREGAPDLFHSIGLERGGPTEEIPSMAAGFVRDKGRDYKTGGRTLGDALREAQGRGIFEAASSGQEGAWATPKVQAELAKLGALPKEVREMPNPTGVDMMRRYKGKYTGPERVPSGPEYRAEQRVFTEAGMKTPTVQLPSLPVQALRDQGLLTDTGLLPALRNIPHRVQELADGSAAISLPGGNSDTARYVASMFGDALGGEGVTITYPKFDAPTVGGIGAVVDPARLDEVVQQLEDLGAHVLTGTDRGSLHLPATDVNQSLTTQISDTLSAAGDAVKDLTRYQGVAEHVDAGSFGQNIRGAGPRFAPTGSVRPDLLERTLGVLREAAGPGAGSAAAIGERAARPLRSQLVQGAVGGGIAGGYSASQQEGATPGDIARGVATGIPLGVARAVLPGSALRNVARLGAIAERTQGEGGIFDSPEVARLMDLARGRGVDPAELIQREITRLQNVPAHLAENAAPRLDNLRGALGELTNPIPQEAKAAVEGAAPAARVAEEAGPTAAELLRPPELSDGAREFAGNLRLGKYVPAEVRDIIATVYDTNPDVMEAARRGVVPDQVVREMAQEIGAKSVDAVVKRWKHGGAENAETIYALRQAMANEGRNVLTAQRGLRRTPESADARLALVNAVTRMQSIEEAVAGYTAEAGRAVRQFRDPIEGQNAMLSRLIKVARAKSMNVEELVNEISEIPLEDPKEALKLARALNPTSKWEKAWALWYFGLLSTPMTHLRNMSSNAVTAGMTPVESLSAAAHDPLARAAFKAVGAQTSGRERFFGEALQDIKGLAKPLYSREAGLAEQDADAVGLTAGLPQGFRRALRAYANEGVTAEDILSGHAHPEAWQGAAGAVIHAPGRGLRGEDAFFKALNESAAGHRMAYREAMRAGLGRDPEGLAAYMAELLHNPDPKFIEEVIRQGKYRTFNADSGFANWLIQGRNRFPALRAVMPFVRTPWNITKFVAERSPAGYLGILKDLGAARLTTSGRESLQARGVGDLADRMGRATMGSLLAAGISHYAGDNLTGRAPDDPTERDAFYRQGKQPYSMKIGNTWQSYQPLQPYAPIFAGVANMKEQLRKDPKAAENMPGMAGQLALAMGQGLFDMPWTQGLADAVDLFSSGGGPGQDTQAKFGRLVEQQAGSAIPGIVRAFARAHDQTIRDPQNPLEAMAANIPFLEDRVAPRLDVWGNPRQRPSGGAGSLINVFNPSEATRDPVEQGLSDLQLKGYQVEPGFVGKNMTERGLPVELSDEQQRAYQQSSGQAAYSVLSLVMGTKEWEALPSDKKAEFIEQVVRDTREYGRSRLIPELMPKFKESFEKLQQRAAGG